MSTPRLDRATAIRDALRAAGVNAVTDITEAIANLPCVVIGPPALTYDVPEGSTATWRLACVAAVPLGNAEAWRQLDHLLTVVEVTVDVTRADPASYRLPTGGDLLPAYIATVTEAVS